MEPDTAATGFTVSTWPSMVAQSTPKVREAPDESDRKTGSGHSAATAAQLSQLVSEENIHPETALEAVVTYGRFNQTCRRLPSLSRYNLGLVT